MSKLITEETNSILDNYISYEILQEILLSVSVREVYVFFCFFKVGPNISM